MDILRIRREVIEAAKSFALVETHPTNDGGVFVKLGLQTSAGNVYVATMLFPNYPSQMPKVLVTKPALQLGTVHRYNDGSICYLHPNMWNPGRHDLTFVIWRTAKWLNKYEVWRGTGVWPGAEMRH